MTSLSRAEKREIQRYINEALFQGKYVVHTSDVDNMRPIREVDSQRGTCTVFAVQVSYTTILVRVQPTNKERHVIDAKVIKW